MNRNKLVKSQKELSVVADKRDSLYPISSIESVVNMVERPKLAPAIALVEVMMSIVILLLVILGASGYRYYSSLDARRADLQITAARLGSLILEAWRGDSDSDRGYNSEGEGYESFSPTTDLDPGMTVETIIEWPDDISIGTYHPIGFYKIPIEGVNYYASLWWRDLDVELDENGQPTGRCLRSLNVIVRWDWRSDDWRWYDRLTRFTSYAALPRD